MLWCYQQHSGNHEAFPVCHAVPEPPSSFPKWPGSGPCIPSPWHQAPDLLGKASCLQSGTLFPPGKAPCSLEGFWLQLDGTGWGETWGRGQAAGSRSWRGGRSGTALPAAWGQLPITWLWPGVRGHLSTSVGAHVVALHPYVHMWMALLHAYFGEPSVGLWQRLSLPHCLALHSDTQGLSHPCAMQLNPVPITCALHGAPAPGKDPGSRTWRVPPDRMSG